MTIRLDHTIVASRDKTTAAQFLAEIFGLDVRHQGPFAQVRINDSLTFDFADDPDHGGDSGARGRHFAFHIDDAEFDAIFARVRERNLTYGSGPFSPADGRINTRRGGRGFYFEDPDHNLLEVMTVPETGSGG